MTRAKNHIDSFGFKPGKHINGKYQIISQLGAGWEGEVYRIKERGTRIERAAKFFFPQRNKRGQSSTRYARKLHKLRQCPILIQYHTREVIEFNGIPVVCLISDYVEGEILKDFLKRQRGKRLPVFEAISLLHTLAVGLECVHRTGEYHGDLHNENIIIQRHGLGFNVKLLDLFHWGQMSKANMQGDICDMIKIFYDAVGGRRHYKNQPTEVKAICCGLKRSIILKKFKNATLLREYLETMSWDDAI